MMNTSTDTVYSKDLFYPEGNYRVWLYDAKYGDWERCKSENIWGLNDDDLDYSQFSSYEEYKQYYYDNGGIKTNDKMLKSNYALYGKMSIGDIIIVRRVLNNLLGYGVVKSDYKYDASKENLKSYREVEWHLKEIPIKIKAQTIWFNEIKRKIFAPLFKVLGIAVETPEMLCTRLIDYYKQLHKKSPFGGFTEKYKWELVNACKGADPLKIVSKFSKQPYNNLMSMYSLSTLGMISKEHSNELKQIISSDLYNDEKPLKERLEDCAEKIKAISPAGKTSPNDESTLASLLTCHDPNRYAFYMNHRTYRPFCEYLGVDIAKTKYANYPHFLELLSILTTQVSKDEELKEMIKDSTSEYEQYDMMTAQTILWCMQGHWHDLMNDDEEEVNMKERIKKFYADNNILDVYQQRISLDEGKPNVWLWAPGQSAVEWENLKYTSEMALGWDYIGDLSQYSSDQDMFTALKSNEEYKNKSPEQAMYMLKAFRDDIKVGDLIFAKNGLTEIVGWGYVTSDYYFSPSASNLKSRRKAKWMSSNTFALKNRKLPQKSLTEISKYPELLSEIFNLFENKKPMEYGIPSPEIINAAKLLKNIGPIILQGAPGCGKTYLTTELAVYICDGHIAKTRKENKERYKELQKEGRIGFTTFHQSLDYEEFVEGLKPDTESEDEEMKFCVKPGIFKKMCENASNKVSSNFSDCYDKFIEDISDKEDFPIQSVTGATFHVRVNSHGNLTLLTSAEKNVNGTLTKENIQSTYLGKTVFWYGYMMGVVNYLKKDYGLTEPTYDNGEAKKYVLIIDEINRANISKVLGELITLLEKSKRIGESDEIMVTLPYSGKPFGVPANLYIIGTMNTADRSIGYIDYAVRRRFAFMTLESKHYSIREFYHDRGELFDKETKLYNDIRTLIKENLANDFEFEDFMIGHSYFMAKTDEDYELNRDYKIIPLLKEYLRDGILVNGDNIKERISKLGK